MWLIYNWKTWPKKTTAEDQAILCASLRLALKGSGVPWAGVSIVPQNGSVFPSAWFWARIRRERGPWCTYMGDRVYRENGEGLLTNQRPDSGSLPQICYHEASLWRNKSVFPYLYYCSIQITFHIFRLWSQYGIGENNKSVKTRCTVITCTASHLHRDMTSIKKTNAL